MNGFGINTPTITSTKLIPEHFEQLKQSVRNLYWKPNKQGFNDKVVAYNIKQIVGDYGIFLEKCLDFSSFKEVFDFYITSNREKFDELINKIYLEVKSNPEWEGITKYKVEACFICRLGNAYYGINKEEEIIKLLNDLEGITCHKVDEETDINYKVDCIIELLPLVRVALQIKPVSRLNYDEGNENEFHEEYTKKTGLDVLYLYYDKSTIILNGTKVDMKDKNQILNLVYEL